MISHKNENKTYSLQDRMPRLPVPDLKKTCEKYLKTVKPLVTQEEFERTRREVEKFVENDGIGRKV